MIFWWLRMKKTVRASVPLILFVNIFSSMAFLVYSNRLRDSSTDLVPLLLKTIAIAWPKTEVVNAYASTGTKGVRTYAFLHQCVSLTIAVASFHMTQMRSVSQLTR